MFGPSKRATHRSYPRDLYSSPALIAFLGGQAILGDDGASLSDPGVAKALIGSAAYLTGAGLFGLAIGALLRSTAAAISTLFGVLFLLEGVVMLLLPTSWQDNIGPHLPAEAGAAFSLVERSPNDLSPWAGLAVFTGYLAAVGAAAAWRLRKHDAWVPGCDAVAGVRAIAERAPRRRPVQVPDSTSTQASSIFSSRRASLRTMTKNSPSP